MGVRPGPKPIPAPKHGGGRIYIVQTGPALDREDTCPYTGKTLSSGNCCSQHLQPCKGPACNEMTTSIYCCGECEIWTELLGADINA